MTERGHLLGGRYQLDQVIGRGGMAEVWRARDTRLQRDVAIKRLRLDLASDSTFQARFRREAQASAGLNHPNIVAVYDTGEEQDPASGTMVPYIVMELIEGVTLREVLRGGRKIVPEKALEFTMGVLDALAYSHRAGIIHRDIKPANVMFTPPGTVKVMDFGIARAVADTSATMTQTAAVIGTAQYLSPEQARGQKVDNRSDIYAVGVLLYELLVSEPPFKGDSPVSVVFQHVRETPIRPSERDPEITPEMDAIVMKALAKDPRDRYQDASEMREDIQRVLNHQPITTQIPAPHTDAPTQVIAADPITSNARRAAPPAALGAGSAAATGAGAAQAAVPTSANTANLEAIADEEEAKPRKAVPIVLGVLGGLLLLAVIILLWLMFGNGPGAAPSASPSPSPSATSVEPSPTPTPTMIPVPRLVGESEQIAVNRLTDLGLIPKVEYEEGDADNNGKVLSTDPEGGSQVEQGSEVKVVVAKFEAPTQLTIPEDIIGKSEADARKMLEQAGFTGSIESRAADPTSESIDAKKGTVTAVTPTGSAAPDTTIILTIATGESIVPSLLGMTAEKAQEEAAARGFEIVVEEVVDGDHLAGVVFEQNPNEGVRMSRDQKIQVSIAVAPEPTETTEPSDGNS